jgi:hypothetical protein
MMIQAHVVGVMMSGQRTENAWNNNQPNNVPTVPGTMRERPLPKPSDKIWAGWDSMKFTPGRRIGALSKAGLGVDEFTMSV